MFESIRGLPVTPRERAGLVWGMVRAGCLSAFGGLALAYVIVAACSDDGPAPRAASPPPEAPRPSSPSEPPKDPIAAVDEQADHARAQKDESAALASYIAARALLDLAERDGAPAKDVKPRRAALDKAITRIECDLGAADRAGRVRNVVLDAMGRAWMSGDVTVSGKCGTTITIEWAGFSDVSVKQFDDQIRHSLRKAGFTRIRYESFDQYWTQTFD